MRSAPGTQIVLYDGVCGLCNGLVRFVLRRDRHRRFRFAALQSAFARELLERHGRNPRDLDTLYVVLEPGGEAERLIDKSRAVLYVLHAIGGLWALVAIAGLFPAGLLDAAYALVARCRYRLFGRHEACPMPEDKWRDRFLDV